MIPSGSGILKCYFDCKKGLVWKATAPVLETVASEPLDSAFDRSDGGESNRLYIGITSDGSRILVVPVPLPNRDVTPLFVFDGAGKIRRTVLISNSYAFDANWQLERSDSDNRFVLRLVTHAAIPASDALTKRQDESCIVDAEGNLIARPVDPEGCPVVVRRLSADGSMAFGAAAREGHYIHYLYKLPGKAPASGIVPPSPEIAPQSR